MFTGREGSEGSSYIERLRARVTRMRVNGVIVINLQILHTPSQGCRR